MQKTIVSCTIDSTGYRKQEHPTGFDKLILKITLESNDVIDEDMHQVIKMSEDTYCPVISMIKGNVNVEILFDIHNH